MINKFQQGGKLQEAIMLFVLGIALVLLADPNQVILIAQLNPDAFEAAVQTFQQTQDINQAAQTFQQALQQKVRAEKHGAKLLYIKSLKHQCADDEELYYYKKGGSVGCGCKKKEEGGEITKAGTEHSAVKKFKARKMEDGGGSQKRLNPKTTKILPNGKYPEYWTSQERQTWERLYGDNDEGAATVSGIEHNNSKETNPSDSKREEPFEPKVTKGTPSKKISRKRTLQQISIQKRGGVCPKCGKVHSAGMGCVVAKFKAAKCGTKMKKHQLGGSLNGIPFIKKELLKKE